MRLRDILILLGLMALILVLTVAEKYSQRTREDRREEELARSLAKRQEATLQEYRERWTDLSDGLRLTLDSMAADIVSGGVPEESLAVMVVEPSPETVFVEVESSPPPERAAIDTKLAPTENEEEMASTASDEPVPNQAEDEDDFARRVAGEYHEALRSLPKDLNAYEQRVATNEIASLIRTRYNLPVDRFDRLLKRAASLSNGGG